MLAKTYVLFIENEYSLRYMSECMNSLSGIDTDVRPVRGLQGFHYLELCHKLGFTPSTAIALEQATLNLEASGTFCCTIGHYVIWEMIAASGVPGVVLEHDAVVKGDYTNLIVEDGEILFLGPRVYAKDDYTFPGGDYDYIPIDRFEGAHAYALTANTARVMLDIVRNIPLQCSVDGQLGMRNELGLKLKTVDPPPVVAAIGDRYSFTESNGIPALWNALHTPKFLSNMVEGAFIPYLLDDLLIQNL